MANNDVLRKTAAKLVTVLEKEGDALRNADFTAATSLVSIKEQLAQRLEFALSAQPETVEKASVSKDLRKAAKFAKRNETLLLAAKEGVVQAQARLKSVSEARRRVGVYGQNGADVVMPGADVSQNRTA
ncbi:MAG: hypothetical protein AAF850_05170 [Pseudomonadota bacterium]